MFMLVPKWLVFFGISSIWTQFRKTCLHLACVRPPEAGAINAIWDHKAPFQHYTRQMLWGSSSSGQVMRCIGFCSRSFCKHVWSLLGSRIGFLFPAPFPCFFAERFIESKSSIGFVSRPFFLIPGSRIGTFFRPFFPQWRAIRHPH